MCMGGVNSNSTPLEAIFDPPTPGEHFGPPPGQQVVPGPRAHIKVPSLSSVNEIIFSRLRHLRRANIVLHCIREYLSDNFYFSGTHL